MTDESDATQRRAAGGRPRWVGGVVVIFIILFLGAALFARQLFPRDSGQPPLTQWQAVMRQVQDGQVPKDVALQAFSLAFRVDIPGVTLPGGVPADDVPTSGTGIVRWVDSHWTELTPEQRAVIERYVIPMPDEIAGTARSPQLAAAGNLAPVGAAPGAADLTTGILFDKDNCNRPLDHPEPAGMDDAFETDLAADVQRLAGELGVPPISDVSVSFLDVDGGNTIFQTRAIEGSICPYSPCNVFVYKNLWSQTATAQNTVSPAIHVLLTHEAVHCLQFSLYPDVSTGLAMPPWISEGTAIWIAAMDTQLSEPALPSVWTKGVFYRPDWALTNRSYDAFGYFALLDHLGRPLFSLMKPAWQAAANNPAQRSEAFIAVLNGDAQDVRQAWAPSHLRQADWGDPWIAYGFGLPDDAQVWRQWIVAEKENPTVGQMESRSNFVRQVVSSDGEIVQVDITTDGLANAHDEQGQAVLAFESKLFCVSGDCICPPNTPRAGEHVADTKMSIPFVLAFNAPRGGATYTVVARSLDEVCGKPKPTPAPQGSGGFGGGGGSPCGSGCGGSNGDPHLVTIDGTRYDFQAAGEFVLLRSPDGTVEMQARQEPYEDADAVSINTAIASLVNGHRVGVYQLESGFEVHIDGQVTTASTSDLGGDASVLIHPGGVEIDFPDGTILWALPTSGYGINAQVLPSAALLKDAAGILGLAPPAGMRIPLLPDGTQLPAPVGRAERHELLYQRFADAWRVTDATSLFDYDPGRSTADYTKPDFPGEAADTTLEDLAADLRAKGETACDEITDTDLRNWCIFDVAMTSNTGFVDGYETTQTFLATGTAALEVPPPPTTPEPTPTETEPPPSSELVPVLTDFRGLHGASIGADGTVYLGLERTTGAFEVLAIDPTTQEVKQTAEISSAVQVLAAADSVWVSGGGGAEPCSLTRLDGVSLEVQATLTIPCALFGPSAIASLDDAIWFVDQTTADAQGKGARLRRIDPATNEPDTGVELPFLNGFLLYSDGAIFYWDGSAAWNMLRPGAAAFVELATSDVGRPGGEALWVPSQDFATAQAYTGPGASTASVRIDGSLVSADANALYLERSSAGPDELWRTPIDGGQSSRVLTGASVTVGETQRDLGFFDDNPLLIGRDRIVKVWPVFENAENPQSALFMESAPLP